MSVAITGDAIAIFRYSTDNIRRLMSGWPTVTREGGVEHFDIPAKPPCVLSCDEEERLTP
jgi:hypothetical protein